MAEIARHEAYHAAALVCLGRPPSTVRIDWPDADTAGSTRLDWSKGADRESSEDVIVALLLGPFGDQTEGWPPDWPIDPAACDVGASRDARQIQRLCEIWGLDRVDYSRAWWRAMRLARMPRFRRLVVAIADELERVEVLDADDIKRIADATEKEEEAL